MARAKRRTTGPHPERLPEFFDATYDLDADDQTWLAQVMESVRSVWGQGGPVHGVIYDASDVTDFRPLKLHLSGFDTRGIEAIRCGAGLHTPAMVARTYRAELVAYSRAVAPEMLPMLEMLSAVGFPDGLNVNGLDPGGLGVFISLWEPRHGAKDVEAFAFYRCLAHHIGAAHRCRRRLRRGQTDDRVSIDATAGAEAILDQRGRIIHATGLATARSAQENIVETSKARDLARTKPADLEQSLRRWRPLTSARWTLVDSFERGGARYVVARENQVEVGGLAALTDRERQAVAYLAVGISTKETAYALGISDVTVRVLLARAMAKLRVRSRAGLLEHPEVRVLRPHPTEDDDPSSRPKRDA